MIEEVTSCSGAPRDLGFDQGRACRNALREGFARAGLKTGRSRFPSLRPWSSGPVLGSGLGREIIRHYPHLSERMAGLAQGADVPLDSLVSYMNARVVSATSIHRSARALAAAGSSSWLARELPSAGEANQGWTLRRSQPEVGFESVEVTLPWLASAVAGVNEEGLAATIVVQEPTSGEVETGPGLFSLLLIQECLQQFSSLEGCVDWCTKRPSAEDARILFADSSGEIASVEMVQGERGVVRARVGFLAAGTESESSEGVPVDTDESTGAELWDAFLGGSRAAPSVPSAKEPPVAASVRLIPAERRLVWDRVGAAETVLVAGSEAS